MNRSRTITALLALSIAMTLGAAIPAGYYDALKGISDPETLKNAVYTLASPHSHPSTPSAYENYYYNNLKQYFMESDVYPDDKHRWWDMYSDVARYVPSFSGMNREHSFPKSWWGGDTDIPAYVDLNHLYPSDARANTAKSNYPLGEVNRAEKINYDNGITVVGYAVTGQGGGARYVFEPADQYKGDFARTYFYMVTIYQNLTWNTNYMYMLQQNTYPTLKPWAYELLLEWARQDPVSQKEVDRNNVVYRVQNNRNPFIDNPDLAEYIWGNKRGQEFTPVEGGGSVTPGVPTLFSPVDGMALDFGQVDEGSTQSRRLLIEGEYLTGSISLAVTGTDRRMFSIDTRSIDAQLVNAAGGYYLTVNYTPTELGSHSANLTIFDVTGWAAGRSLNVELIGEGAAVPTLSQLTALPASDFTEDSYVANWREAPEQVDYYVVNRTYYRGNNALTEELTAEENSLLIEGYEPGAYESYTVQSVRLGYRSPQSNTVIVSDAGLQSIDGGRPMVVEVYGRILRFVVADRITGVMVYDAAGRLFRRYDSLERNDEIELPVGVWMVTADGHPSPVKVLTR